MAVSTLYYAIGEKFNILREEFPKRPLEVLEDLKTLLGTDGYSIVEPPILDAIKKAFGIREGENLSLKPLVELARKKYVQASLE